MSNEDIVTGKKSFSEVLEKLYPLKDVEYKLRYIEENEDKEIDITYEKLPQQIKRTVNYTNVSVIEIKVDGNEKHRNRILYKVFENLNSAGTPLKNQELRNGVYQCKFYDMIHDINNNNQKWREIFGEKHPHSKDVELLLRFCAVQHNFKFVDGKIAIDNYCNSYPKLLNDFSDQAINFSDEEIKSYKIDLERFINRIEATDNKPRLLLESLYLASQYLPGDFKIGDDLCNKLLDDSKYTDNTLSSSSSKSKVSARFNYVYRELLQYVNGNQR